MNREELIETLLKQDLNKFRYSVFVKFNEKNELEYAYCECESKPEGYETRLFDIGGNPDIKYTYNFLYYEIIMRTRDVLFLM